MTSNSDSGSNANVNHPGEDEGDVFGFSKAKQEHSLVARMPVYRDSMFYNMNHKRRGLAVIFNHENFDMRSLRPRSGTEIDAKNLEAQLLKLGFEVKIFQDLETSKVLKEVHNLAYYDHSDCDCFLMAVLSHGELGIIYGKDSPYKTESLWMNFTANLCPSLAGKPKIFLIQACQGDQLDGGITLSGRTEIDGVMSYRIPVHADFLIVYSTIQGYYSWRNTTKGSWFIQALCNELEKNADKLDFVTLLTMVSQEIAINFESNTPNDYAMHKQKQIPCITSMLTRLIKFDYKDAPVGNLI